MIRKLPFMLIALCFLLSCGGDDPLDIKPEDDIKPEQPEKPEEPDPFQGYLVKNKEGFDINSINILCYNEDSTFLTGFRNEKLWVALFNEHTNERLHEWNGTESFDRTIDINLGYGEHDIFEAISFSFHVGEDEIFEQNYWSRKTSWGYAFAPSFKKNDTESAIKYIFILNGDRILIHDCQESYMRHSNWYNNSMIISTNNEEDFEYIVLSAEGEYITTLHIANPIDDYTYPLSYTDGLDFTAWGVGSFGQNSCWGFVRYRYTDEYATTDAVWRSVITASDEIDLNARISETVLERSDPVWKFQIDAVNPDGSKKQVICTVDVETGKVTEI